MFSGVLLAGVVQHDIDHAQGSVEGSIHLICVQATGSEQFSLLIFPADNALGKGVGVAWGSVLRSQVALAVLPCTGVILSSRHP